MINVINTPLGKVWRRSGPPGWYCAYDPDTFNSIEAFGYSDGVVYSKYPMIEQDAADVAGGMDPLESVINEMYKNGVHIVAEDEPGKFDARDFQEQYNLTINFNQFNINVLANRLRHRGHFAAMIKHLGLFRLAAALFANDKISKAEIREMINFFFPEGHPDRDREILRLLNQARKAGGKVFDSEELEDIGTMRQKKRRQKMKGNG